MKKAPVIHPVLFAIYPVLFLFAHNIGLFHVRVVLVPIVAITSLALLFWVPLSIGLKDKQKAGLIGSLFFLLLFSYGPSFEGVRDVMVALGAGYTFGTRAYVLLPCIILFSVGARFIIKTRRSLDNLTNIANAVAAALVAISLTSIGAYEVRGGPTWVDNENGESTETGPADLEQTGTPPNIYYIILDEYARADILEEIYRYDNDEFLDYLTGKGFYVARKSRSNYSQTILSLASSLNSTYLDTLTDRLGVESDRRVPAINMIWNNNVFRFLKGRGYQIVAFSSGYFGTEMRDVDMYMAARGYVPDEFQWDLMNMTPIPFVGHLLGALGIYDEYGLRRETILYTFDHLADLSELEGPVFVFAHVLAPHQPFIFGEHGEEIDPEYTLQLSRDQYIEGYRNQLAFISDRTKTAVERIMSTSHRPTIIILQADTGPSPMTASGVDDDNTRLRARLSIFNAYYLPNAGDINLYDEITPANTFRVIFNRYFGTDYELLDDQSYFSTTTRPYEFINVTDEVNADTERQDPE